MTPARQPHQQRCETCIHHFKPNYWRDGCDFPRYGTSWFPSGEIVDTISVIGCASHSSAEPVWTDAEVMKEIDEAFDRGIAAAEATIDMQKHDAEIREEGAKAEREQVDKLLNSRIAKMEIINSKKPTQFREGALMAYRDIEESLRAQQESTAARSEREMTADDYEIKGYVTFSKKERDEIVAFLSQPFSKEVLQEMKDVVRKHEEAQFRTKGGDR